MKFLPILILITLLAGNCRSGQAQIIKSIGLRTGLASTFPTVEETQNGRPAQDAVYNRNMIYGEFQSELLPYNHFSLLANFAYISKGFNYFDTWGNGYGFFGGGSGITHANVDYFTIMVAPKVSWQLKGITLYGFAGSYAGLRNAYDAYYKQGLYFMGDNMEVQVLKPRTWGGTAGAGIEFKGKSKRIYYSAQAQYMQDFTKAVDFTFNFTDRYGLNYDYRFKARFQTLLVSAGLHYAFHKKE
jgi:hypothetical protein